MGARWTPAAAVRDLGPLAEGLPRYVEAARRALAPSDARWLSDRLSTMWLAMAGGKTEAQATAWLHETQRLLMDVPSDILGPAIDAAVKASARGFMPSVGEIRAFADPKLTERKRMLGKLESMAASYRPAPAERCIEPAAEIIPPEEIRRMTRQFLNIGLKQGWLTQDQIDAAFA